MYVSRRGRSMRMADFKHKIILWGLLGIIGLVLFGFLASFLVFAWFSRDLPEPGKLSQSAEGSTVFYDRNGKVLYGLYKDKNRVPVASSDISDYLKKGTISIEDKDFYKHGGISQTGMIRSTINILLGKGLQSGSTITQQLIKNVLLDTQQTLPRKVKEMVLAGEVERRYTKDQILEMYLNEVPYGGTFYGVGAAAKGYFGKSPKDLNLLESAFLAGLPQSPSVYSPFIGVKDAWKGRTTDVLRRMREDGYISRDQEQQALKDMEKMKFTAPNLAINAPHFVFYVKDQIEKEYGAKALDQGLKIKTTIDEDIQDQTEQIVKEEIAKLKGLNVTNGAVVVLDSKTGEILSMVGSYDFNDDKFGKFNAALGLRQPGSAMKPINYAVAFEKGYTPATVLMDVKTDFTSGATTDKPYTPVNYDGKFHGPVQVRFALGNSMNIPAVKMLAMIGIRDFLQKAYDMGLTQFEPTQDNLNRFGLSVTLGGGETTLLDLTNAYSIFARGGTKLDVQSIMEISDFNGKKIYSATRPKQKQVLSPEVSFLISHILSDNNARVLEFGPNSYLHVPGKTVAVKTGTTDDKRDNWAVGYTKDITVGVWVGNNDNSVMDQKIASGVTGASPIWYRVMNAMLKKYGDGIMEKPDKVKAVTIDAYLGGLPKDGQPTRSEYFIEGTEPKDVSPFYKKLKISKANGKLANDVEVRSSNYDEKDFIVITENDPLATDGKNRWQDAINAWAKEQTDDKYKYPTDTSDANADDIGVSIKSPTNEGQTGNSVEVKVKIGSVAPVTNVKIFVNGSQVKSIDGDNKDIDETIQLSDGAYELRVLARNDKGKERDSIIHFGVNKPWNSAPAPSPTP